MLFLCSVIAYDFLWYDVVAFALLLIAALYYKFEINIECKNKEWCKIFNTG